MHGAVDAVLITQIRHRYFFEQVSADNGHLLFETDTLSLPCAHLFLTSRITHSFEEKLRYRLRQYTQSDARR